MADKNKTLKTRVQLKHETEANWNKATNFIPLAGEVIIYEPDEYHTQQRVKIGDGITKVNDLAFSTDICWKIDVIEDQTLYYIVEEQYNDEEESIYCVTNKTFNVYEEAHNHGDDWTTDDTNEPIIEVYLSAEDKRYEMTYICVKRVGPVYIRTDELLSPLGGMIMPNSFTKTGEQVYITQSSSLIYYTPLSITDSLKIIYSNLNIVTGQKTEYKGEIFNDYNNNEAVSQYATAIGSTTRAGLRGWAIQDYGEEDWGDEYLRQILYIAPDAESDLALGDTISLILTSNHWNVYTINDIYLIDDRLKLVLNENILLADLGIEQGGYVCKIDKPEWGDTDLGLYASAEGWGTQALYWAAHAEGMDTKALAQHSHTEGRLTQATGVSAHAEGLRSNASGAQAHAEGRDTIASGSYGSHAEGYKTQALSRYSHAEGRSTIAGTKNDADEGGLCAHAEGNATRALGDFSHAEGDATEATGQHSHAEGQNTIASGRNSHAEGYETKAEGAYTHAEGMNTQATGENAHAEGLNTRATGTGSHAEGENTQALHRTAHAEGYSTIANGIYSHAEGNLSHAIGSNSHAEGDSTEAMGISAHAEGSATGAEGNYSHAEGYGSMSQGENAHAEGYYTGANSKNSHAEGQETQSNNEGAHAEGVHTIANGIGSHAEGGETTATGSYAHTEGYLTSTTYRYAHAEGRKTVASGESAHAEGEVSTASGTASHAEGQQTTASGRWSHAEGSVTKAIGDKSHAGGRKSEAHGENSFAHGQTVKAKEDNQFVVGKYNADNSNAIFIVGNGTGTAYDDKQYANAFMVLKDGRAVIASAPTGLMDVANKAYVDRVSQPLQPLLVTIDENDMASHTPTEIFEYVQQGGQVYLNGWALSNYENPQDQSYAFFNYVEEEGSYGTYVIYSDGRVVDTYQFPLHYYDPDKQKACINDDIYMTGDIETEGSIKSIGSSIFSNMYVENATFSRTITFEQNAQVSFNGPIDHRNDINMLANRIHNLLDPIDLQDASTKNYVDQAVASKSQIQIINWEDED